MLIYYGMLLCIVLAGLLLCGKNKTPLKNGIYCLLIGAMFAFVAANRFATGSDYGNYSTIYNTVAELDWNALSTMPQETGYLLLCKVLSSFSLNYQMIFIAIGLLVAALFFCYIYNHSSNVWISAASFLLFGLFYNSINFMRQTVAALIVMYAFRYVQKRQFWRYIVIVLLASTFHISAFIMIPFYFILQIKMNRITLAAYLVVTGILYVNSDKILSIITQIYYPVYSPDKQNPEVMLGISPVYSIAFFALFLIAFLLRKQLAERGKYNLIMLNCLFFAAFFEFIGTKHGILSRLTLLFFIPAVTILVPEIILCIHKRLESTVSNPKTVHALFAGSAGLMAVCMLGYHQYLLDTNYNGVVPYMTYRQGVAQMTEEIRREQRVDGNPLEKYREVVIDEQGVEHLGELPMPEGKPMILPIGEYGKEPAK